MLSFRRTSRPNQPARPVRKQSVPETSQDYKTVLMDNFKSFGTWRTEINEQLISDYFNGVSETKAVPLKRYMRKRSDQDLSLGEVRLDSPDLLIHYGMDRDTSTCLAVEAFLHWGIPRVQLTKRKVSQGSVASSSPSSISSSTSISSLDIPSIDGTDDSDNEPKEEPEAADDLVSVIVKPSFGSSW